MRRKPSQKRDLRSTAALLSGAFLAVHRAITLCTSQSGSASVKACDWPVCQKDDARYGSPKRPADARPIIPRLEAAMKHWTTTVAANLFRIPGGGRENFPGKNAFSPSP